MKTLAFVIFLGLAAAQVPSQAQADFQPPQEPVGVFIVTRPTTAKVAPSPAAKVTETYKAQDILSVWGAREGWLAVTKGPFDANKIGTSWIACTAADAKANLINDDALTAMIRQTSMKNKPWPLDIKNDILRKRVRIGFSTEQLVTALGEPLRKQSQETATGITELWFYIDESIGLKNGAVAVINKTNATR